MYQTKISILSLPNNDLQWDVAILYNGNTVANVHILLTTLRKMGFIKKIALFKNNHRHGGLWTPAGQHTTMPVIHSGCQFSTGLIYIYEVGRIVPH